MVLILPLNSIHKKAPLCEAVLRMVPRGGMIQTAFGMFVLFGRRSAVCAAVAAFEPPTQGFSVDSVTDSLI